MKTSDCVALLDQEDLSKFDMLRTSVPAIWKRVNKFNYKDGLRRYFYLLDSCVIATVDELSDGSAKVVVRPPMLWETYMLQSARRDDDFVQEELPELYDDNYDFCNQEAAKHSEPEQYYFDMGSEDGGWIFFSPKKYDGYDQHLTGDLYNIVPTAIRDNEECECTYSLYGIDSRTDIKQELIDLGFEYKSMN